MKRFLYKVGRRKYIAPIYSALIKTPENLLWAKKVFLRANVSYHFVTFSTVNEMLYPKGNGNIHHH